MHMFVMASFGGQLLTTNVVAFDFDPRGCWFACFCSFLPFFFAANRATQSYYFPPFSPRPAQKFEFPASFLGSDEVFQEFNHLISQKVIHNPIARVSDAIR